MSLVVKFTANFAISVHIFAPNSQSRDISLCVAFARRANLCTRDSAVTVSPSWIPKRNGTGEGIHALSPPISLPLEVASDSRARSFCRVAVTLRPTGRTINPLVIPKSRYIGFCWQVECDRRSIYRRSRAAPTKLLNFNALNSAPRALLVIPTRLATGREQEGLARVVIVAAGREDTAYLGPRSVSVALIIKIVGDRESEISDRYLR